MTLHLKIDTEKSLSLDEAKELLRQSEDKGLDPSDLALDYLRQGIRAGAKSAPSTSSPAPATPPLPRSNRNPSAA